MAIDIDKEKALIACVKQNDRAAFDELVKMHRGKGFAIAYNILGNFEDAKDVLQEAFIKVYLNIKTFKQEAKFSTWFYRILVNCSWDFLRKRKRVDKLFILPLTDEQGTERDIPDFQFEPAKLIINKELSRNLDIAIASLPERQRLCFVLKHQNGLSNQEIAKVLRCSLSTVKVHLFRAVRALQDKLSTYLIK